MVSKPSPETLATDRIARVLHAMSGWIHAGNTPDHITGDDALGALSDLGDLLRDRERLGWLDEHAETHVLDYQCGIWCCSPNETDSPDNYQGSTPREAIDAAMEASDGE